MSLLASLVGQTAAFFTGTVNIGSNSLSSGKLFQLSDVTAVSQAGGNIRLSWSAASWPTGYSVQRGTAQTGPFTQVGTTDSATFAFTDTPANGLLDNTIYYYVVRGISANGGHGSDSNVASATSIQTAPTISSLKPANAATGVSESASITVTFSQDMYQAQAAANISLLPCTDGTSSCSTRGSAISGGPSWESGNVLYFTPNASLAASSWYGIFFYMAADGSGVQDVSGNYLNQSSCPQVDTTNYYCYATFQTSSSNSPWGVAAASPQLGYVVGTNASVFIRFTGATPSATNTTDLQNGFYLYDAVQGCYVQGGTPLCATSGGTFATWVNRTLKFTPTGGLAASNPAYSHRYSYGEHTAASVTVDYDSWFYTDLGADTTAPTVSYVLPTNGATGVDPATSIALGFSESMDASVMTSSFTLKPYAGPGCTGTLGSSVAGTKVRSTALSFTFSPTASLTAGQCYQVGESISAKDTAGNALADFTSTFTVGSAGSSIAFSDGSNGNYYPGGKAQATGSRWVASGSNVIPYWEDGTALSGGAAPDGSGNVDLSDTTAKAFYLPVGASAGQHFVQFVESGGPTETVNVTIWQPPTIALSASPTDVSPGGSTTITATVHDQNGAAAANVGLSFSISSDPSLTGSLSASSGVTNASGQASVTLSTNASISPFQPISVYVSSGSAARTITIVDPPLPAPTDLRLAAAAGGGLSISWHASPSSQVKGYRVYLGTSTEKYNIDADAGTATTYVYPQATAGATYYAIVRAYNRLGGLGLASAESSLLLPLGTPTPTSTATPTLTPPACEASPTVIAATPPATTATPNMTAAAGTRTSCPAATATTTLTGTPATTTATPTGTPTTTTPTATGTPGTTTPTGTPATLTPGPTPTDVGTPAATTTSTETPGVIDTSTPTPTVAATSAPTLAAEAALATIGIPTATSLPVASSTPSAISIPVASSTPTAMSLPAATSTRTATAIPPATSTPSAIATTAAATATVPATRTGTPTATSVVGCSPIPTATATAAILTGTATATATATATPTSTCSPTPVASATPSSTPTVVASATAPSSPTATATAVSTSTSTPSPSATATTIPTATTTPTATATNPPTVPPSATPVPTPRSAAPSV